MTTWDRRREEFLSKKEREREREREREEEEEEEEKERKDMEWWDGERKREIKK